MRIVTKDLTRQSLAMVFMALMVGPLSARLAQASEPIEAVARARYDLQLGFNIKGKVAQVMVEAGQRVKAGDVLVKLEDAEPAAILSQAQIQAESNLAVEAAEAQLELQKIERDSVVQLFARNATTKIEVDRNEVQVKLRQLELDLQRQQQLVSQAELEQAKANHAKYFILAPQGGEVVDIAKEAGESVEEREDVVRLVVTDPLWIDAPVPTTRTLNLTVGRAVWVTAALTGFTDALEGKIVYISPVADAASDTRVVRVEVSNDRGLPAGTHVMVHFEIPESTTTEESGS